MSSPQPQPPPGDDGPADTTKDRPADANKDANELSMKCYGVWSKSKAEDDGHKRSCTGVLMVFAEAAKGQITKSQIPEAWIRVVAYTQKNVKNAPRNTPKEPEAKTMPWEEPQDQPETILNSADKRKELVTNVTQTYSGIITNPAHRAEFLEGMQEFFVGQADFIKRTLVQAASFSIVNAVTITPGIITGVYTDVLRPAARFIRKRWQDWNGED